VLCRVVTVRVIEERDITTLQTVAEYVSALLRPTSLDTATSSMPAARNELERVAGAFADGGTLERLSRPLLEMLQEATGLDSTYLTAVDWAADEQRVLYAVNKGQMQIPEGVAFDWSDTLCRRSLEEGRACTTDVPSVWGDSEAAAALGIVTYVSVPVLDPDSNVIGTLCGASSRRRRRRRSSLGDHADVLRPHRPADRDPGQCHRPAAACRRARESPHRG
jgi:hypothetical protein